MILSLMLMAAQVPHAAPPIVAPFLPTSRMQPTIVQFRANPVRCAGAEQRPALIEPPLPKVSMVDPEAQASFAPVSLRFRIDASGRPLSIAVAPKSPGRYVDDSDVAAAFAAWRFQPGSERSSCEIDFQPEPVTLASAPLPLVHRFLVFSAGDLAGSSIRRPAFERAHPAGSNCTATPTPQIRLRAYPDFSRIARPAGSLSHSMISFDIHAEGQPENVYVLSSSGNAELDRASADAVQRSRFTPGVKKGCTYPYWLAPAGVMASPEVPDQASFRSASATCPAELGEWSYMPPLAFPPAFERRRIEGWAILSYDLAPWGAVGNIKTLAAEPASAFGAQAAQILAQARKPASPTGYTGCVTKIRFVINQSAPPPQQQQ